MSHSKKLPEDKSEDFNEIISLLTHLKEDEGVPKNIRAKIDVITSELNSSADLATRVGKSLQHLDEISEDLNIEPMIRQQVWNISSKLEKLNN